MKEHEKPIRVPFCFNWHLEPEDRMRHIAVLFLPCLIALAAQGPTGEDILIADFEGKDYGDWKVTGTAFGPGPARGTLPGQMPVSGYLGQGLVNSFFGGDSSVGTLTSPAFKIQRKYINFLVGGGKHPDQTCINLLIAGKGIRTATGPNDRPGGSEQLDWHTWDVAELVGKDAVIEIVDNHTGGWGHINIDHIVQSNRKKMAAALQRTISVDRRYLHLPVKNGAAMRRMKFLVDGNTVREFDIELAEGTPDFWVFSEVEKFKGKQLIVEVTLPEDSTALDQMRQADDVPDAATMYKEKHRPQFHFTARRGWLNDPNGLVFHEGKYHLFFQHNPYGWKWGNMHWGHAVSKDLVHWHEIGEALYPRQYGDWCFSGSAFVVPGAGQAGTSLAAAFTSTGRGECIVFGHQGGREWVEKPAMNPVVKHRGRDPRVFWHEPTKQWVMAVYDEEKGRTIAFYTASDLAKWQFQSRIGEFYECPDLSELPIDGNAKNCKWVLYAADGRYVLGQFDGKQFTAEPGRHQLWHGQFYAAQTFNNAPGGRRVQIGWAQIAFPGMPFNQQMTIPCELSLRTTADGVRMFAVPVAEIARLRSEEGEQTKVTVQAGKALTAKVQGELLDIEAELQPRGAVQFGLIVRGVRIVYDVKKQTLTCGNHTASLALSNGSLRLRILVDRGSVEAFGNDGRVAIVYGSMLPPENTRVGVFAEGGDLHATQFAVRRLRSAW
jgi:fructan beta-fructosidase